MEIQSILKEVLNIHGQKDKKVRVSANIRRSLSLINMLL